MQAGGAGQTWTPAGARVHLARARAALARAKLWAPKNLHENHERILAHQAADLGRIGAEHGAFTALPPVEDLEIEGRRGESARTCAGCGMSKLELLKCSRCAAAFYCGPQCQRSESNGCFLDRFAEKEDS